MPGLEGAATGVGRAVGGAARIEGAGLKGVGAGMGSIGKIEGLGAAAPKPEIGNIGNINVPNIKPEALNLSASLDTKLGTPHLGIQEAALQPNSLVKPDGSPLGMSPQGGLEGASSATAGMDKGQAALDSVGVRETGSAPTTEVSTNGSTPNGSTPPEGSQDDIKVTDRRTSTQIAEGNTNDNKPDGSTDSEASGANANSSKTTDTNAPEATSSDTTKTENGDNGVQGENGKTGEQTQDETQVNKDAATSNEAEKKGAEGKQEAKPEDIDKAKRTKELEDKVKSKSATADEIKELRDLKQDPEQHRQELENKALDGTITDKEAQELGNLNSQEDTKDLTPEQQVEKLNKDIDELGTDLMNKLANGEAITSEDLQRMRNLSSTAQMIQNGFSPEQAKAAINAAIRGEGRTSGERQLQAIKELQQKIQELMGIEIQLLSIPKSVDALRNQRDQVKRQADAKHREASGVSEEQKLQKKGEEYSLYMQIANINAAIVRQKYMVPILKARQQDLEQYVRRKVGVSSGLGALVEWGAAKTRNVATDVGVGVAEEMDYRTGNY